MSDSELQAKSKLQAKVSDSELQAKVSDSELQAKVSNSELQAKVSDSELQAKVSDSELQAKVSDSELDMQAVRACMLVQSMNMLFLTCMANHNPWKVILTSQSGCGAELCGNTSCARYLQVGKDLVFPGSIEREQSFCYLIIDNIKRHVTAWYHVWC